MYNNYYNIKDAKRQRGAKEKLIKLTNQQFQELSTDVYDELIRRTFNSRGIFILFYFYKHVYIFIYIHIYKNHNNYNEIYIQKN